MTASPILSVRNLQKTFGSVVAAKDINIDVAAGEVVGIIGANGAGKTTFVNMVTGYLAPSSGVIEFNQQDITGKAPRLVTRAGISRSFQVSQVFATMTVFDNVLTALAIADSEGFKALRAIDRPALLLRCDETLARYRIAEHRDVVASTLSQGVRKLLDIAMAMVSRPRILLLDEPTSGVSIEEKFDIMDTIMDALKADDVTVLFIEHDMEIIERYVGRVIAFYQGEIICDAPPAQALVDPKVLEFVIGGDHQRAAERG
ncbi:MAG: ABC transporter ATP-binding protein [Alphaproteobacteria bacterium]|jgi:branched-chain amino acid transport system ATP-binding protein